MRVKMTFVCNSINVQETDSKFLLALFESAAYNAAVFPPTYSLHIEEMDFAFRRQGYKIHWPLFDKRGVDVTAAPD